MLLTSLRPSAAAQGLDKAQHVTGGKHTRALKNPEMICERENSALPVGAVHLSFSRHHRSLPALVEVCRVEAFGCRMIILAVATPPVQLIDYPGSCQTSDDWFSDLANRPTSTAFVIYPGRHHTSGHISRLCPGRGHILRLCPGRLAGVDKVPVNCQPM